jgi:hypothetical protein
VTTLQSQLITIEGPLLEMMAADYQRTRSMIASNAGTNLHPVAAAEPPNNNTSSNNNSNNNNSYNKGDDNNTTSTISAGTVITRRGHAKLVREAGRLAAMKMTMMPAGEHNMEEEEEERRDGIDAASESLSSTSSSSSAASSASSSTQSLQIIALEGGIPAPAGSAASVLLAYTCDENGGDPDRGPITDLLLLSRTPTLPPPVVIGLLNTAASLGIYTDCDNPFVPTIQRPDNCAFL